MGGILFNKILPSQYHVPMKIHEGKVLVINVDVELAIYQRSPIIQFEKDYCQKFFLYHCIIPLGGL